jgi:hypothetical protein
MSLGNFIKFVNPSLYKEYVAEKFQTKYKKETKPKLAKNPLLKEHRNPLKHCIPLSELPNDHDAIEYLKNRKVPRQKWKDIYYVHKMGDVANKLKKYKDTEFDEHPRLIFPFRNKDGKITHIQGRAIDRVPKSKRYVTLEIIQDEPKVFGLDSCDMNKDFFIVEGSIDSMFIPNSIAMGGSDLDLSILDKEHAIFVFDNEPRNKEITKRMRGIIDSGYKLVIWDNEVSGLNDINDMIISKFNKEDLLKYMKTRTFSGLKASLELVKFTRGR